MDVFHDLEAVRERHRRRGHRHRTVIGQHCRDPRMSHAAEDFARHIQRVALAGALRHFDRQTAVAGADLEKHRVRMDEGLQQRDASADSGATFSVGNLASQLRV